MNNNLTVKEVGFNGDTLMAAQDSLSKKIYVGVSWICNGIGFSKGQKDRQVKNIQEDEVLKLGCVKLEAGVFDVNNETLAIELDFLPLWLAKISITPKMKEEAPFIAKKLIDYQLKAKDELANAFIHNNALSQELTFLQGLLDTMKTNELRLNSVEDKLSDNENKVVYLETELNKETVIEGYKSNDNLARSFKLFSVKDKPHFGFVDAIAKHLRIYKAVIGYSDQYIKARREVLQGGTAGIAVYYSDLAVELIEKYLNDEFAPAASSYKRTAKKGQFNVAEFELGEKTYKFNENTYKQYQCK